MLWKTDVINMWDRLGEIRSQVVTEDLHTGSCEHLISLSTCDPIPQDRC